MFIVFIAFRLSSLRVIRVPSTGEMNAFSEPW